MAMEIRRPVFCPGELAQTHHLVSISFCFLSDLAKRHMQKGQSIQLSPGPHSVVAHMCFSLYSNNECMVSTSDTLKECEHIHTTKQLKDQLRAEHERTKSMNGLGVKRQGQPMFTTFESQLTVNRPE